jgi:hypothetical protein
MEELSPTILGIEVRRELPMQFLLDRFQILPRAQHTFINPIVVRQRRGGSLPSWAKWRGSFDWQPRLLPAG